MNDTQMLTWVQEHVTAIRQQIEPNDEERWTMEWLDHKGEPHITEGIDLRDCIRGAVAYQRSKPND